MDTLREDQRREKRLQIDGQALIALDGRALGACQMLDFHGRGARLQTLAQDVPERFYLIDLAAGIAYSARAIWRQPPLIGVALLHVRYVEDADTPEWITRLWREARLADANAAPLKADA